VSHVTALTANFQKVKLKINLTAARSPMTTPTPKLISAKILRKNLAKILKQAAQGSLFTIVYRSRPLCRIGPVDASSRERVDLEKEPLYGAGPLGRSTDGKTAADHDELIYEAGSRHRKRR
jgi:antitoxin (DNA-binding transcriptional repressor) of toxin-antitoxin stability system